MKKRKRGMLQRCAVMAMVLMCMLCCASPAFASAPDDYFPGDTDGTEMQLMQPVQLEIRLGQEWVGAQFTLVTDVGQYPGAITVAQDGTLRMEIGGSQSYVLKLVGMGNALPETTAVPDREATPEPEIAPAEGETEGDPAEEGASDEDTGGADAGGGIPIFPIVLFGAGILIAGGVLIVMKVLAKRQASSDDEDDDDDGSEYEDDEDDD